MVHKLFDKSPAIRLYGRNGIIEAKGSVRYSSRQLAWSATLPYIINDIPNCSEKLSFRIFVDDTNIFISSPNSIELETLVNQEILKVKEWCDINKLTINFKKN